MQNLSTNYLGLNLKNPIIAASAGLTDCVDNIKKLEEAGVAAVVLKSIFEEEIVLEMETNMKKMATESFLYPETLDFYGDQDHTSISTDYLELIRKAKEEVDIPVIASINCVTAEHWTYFPKMIEEAGADALELNIFLLPSDLKRTSCENEELYFEILHKIKEQISIPISVKITYYFSSLLQFAKRLDDAGVNAIVLFNRYYNPDFDIDTFELKSGTVLSSPNDYYTSLRWVSMLSGKLNCDLAASTGIHDGKTAIKQLLGGAKVVELASTIYNNGYERIGEMLKDIEEWMESKNFKSIDEFRGKMSQDGSKEPAAYERVQFMKYFRTYK